MQASTASVPSSASATTARPKPPALRMPRMLHGLQTMHLPALMYRLLRPQGTTRPAQAARSPVWLPRLLLLTCSLLPWVVFAQSATPDAGTTLWSAFRSVLYGPWGLVGSALVVAMGIYMFLERGFMHALGVMAAGALIFFVPMIVISMRNTAQALGGAAG